MGDAAVAQTMRPVTPTTILAEELDQVTEQLRGVPGVDASLIARLERARSIAGGLDPYLTVCTSAESPGTARLAERTRAVDWAGTDSSVPLEQEMLSGHVEGVFLRFLVRMLRARHILEIGMFTGYATVAMAEAAGPAGRVVALELDAGAADIARQGFVDAGVDDRITVTVGDAMASLRSLDSRSRAGDLAPFDFVFVDADKAGYRGYLDLLLDSTLLATGAVIAVDNTLMQGEPYTDGPRSPNGTAIADFNAALTYDDRVEQVLVPLRDGITLIRRPDAP